MMEARRTPPSRPPNPALPYREDCWSEGETSVLIDAWGDRYVDHNRGNLRQNQWQEVADAVNSRPCDARRPPRTDVQCKNRIDTLKKKYKVERSKIADGALLSQWIFYDRLDALIGNSNSNVAHKKGSPAVGMVSSPPMALPLPSHRKGFPLPTASAVRPFEMKEKRQTAIMPSNQDSIFRRNYSPVAVGEEEDEEDSDSSTSSGMYRKRARIMVSSKEKGGKGLRREKRGGEEEGVRELSKAIMKMAETYEKVEVEKQRQMMELEKQRMEFAKSLEFQRMQMFVDAQVQLMKMKRGKQRSDADRYM